MKYDIKREENKLLVKVEGELDVRTSPEFQDALIPALEGITDAEIDLAELVYISSAGLRVLLAATKIMEKQGEMNVKNVNEDIMDIFKVTGFDEMLDIG